MNNVDKRNGNVCGIYCISNALNGVQKTAGGYIWK